MRVSPRAGDNSGAENKVRKKITELKLSNSSYEIALWSLHVPKHEKKEFSETDFILITRQGVCCIEVKGGRVRYEDGVFIYPPLCNLSYGTLEPDGIYFMDDG